MEIAVAVAALAIGAVIGFLFARKEATNADELLRAETALRADAEGQAKQIPSLKAEIEAKDGELRELRNMLGAKDAEVAKLTESLEAEKRALQTIADNFAKSREQLAETFKALSQDTLSQSNKQFMELAKATFAQYEKGAAGVFEQKQQAIADLVKPLQESLTKVGGTVEEIEKVRIKAYAGLEVTLKTLSDTQNELRSQTGNLVRALRTPSIRGRWGEIQLRRVVELAGMVSYCDFVEQESADAGRVRPDMIVRLPNAKNIVVDSKAPMAAYLEAHEAADDAVKALKLRDHARQLKAHITSLGSKAYWEQFNPTPEFVVLFVPGENFMSAALENDPTLIEFGVENHVILATPSTLIALLKAVAYGWQQQEVAKHAVAISELGKEMFERTAVLMDHLVDIGTHLDKGVKSYNKAIGSIESRVLPTARKFKDLQIATTEEIPALEPIESQVRELSAKPEPA